ncbi:hypothetical protein L596_021905 [Steinernema carpocapsae]|uniref:Uncharacterized protein n=1 Tax=Steinernema carpocapsae TaxID=34508 RepID=A0A4U5MK66_STECR|nr:hypothetical protein L596_021905 [Steinernema carpocapsae]
MPGVNLFVLILALIVASVGVAQSLPAFAVDTLNNSDLKAFIGDPVWNLRLKSLIEEELQRRFAFEPDYAYFADSFNNIDMPAKRYSRIGGTIVMG